MSATLRLDIIDNFKHIIRLGRIRNQKEKLLSLLRRRPMGVTSRAGRKIGIMNTRARIFELRQAGYSVRTDVRKVNGKIKYFYWLP